MQYSLEIVVWKKCRSVASLLQYSLRRVTRFWKTEGVVFLWKGHKHSGTFLWNAQRYFTIVCSMDAMFIYLYICWVRPNSRNNQKKVFFIFWANVGLSVFLRAQNRAFRCFPSCKKSCSRSCFLVLSPVHKIVLFGAFPRPKKCAFWCSPSCQKPCSRSCFLVLSFVPQILL